MAKLYPARQYKAAPRKQRLRHPVTGFLIGCTDCMLGLAIADATMDTVQVSELAVREMSGEWPIKPTNKSPGLNQDQLEKVADKLHFRYAKCNGQGWAAVVKALREERRIVAQLWYATIGGGNIGHAVLLEALRGTRILFVDPATGKRGWISATKVRKAMADLAVIEGLGSDDLFWGKTAPVPLIAGGAS